MNLILRILVIAVLATLGQLFLPWWTIAIVALLVEALVGKADSTAFYSGFYGIAIPWIALAAYIDMKSGSILTVRILEMFKLPPYGFVMVIVTGLLGGLIGGLSSMLGGWIRQIFQDGKSRTVSLALGSGGARGLAHIGVIQVFEEEGFRIGNIAGSSMGACVGGIYCANKLPTFTDWVLTLNRRETLRLMDFTMSTQGVIKGRKVLEHLKGMLGEIRIEDFEIPYTAVATDVKTKQEVWMRNGDLYSVIRASSSIPTLMMPSKLGDRILIDGGVLNPLPLEPLVPKTTDLLVAVNINANHEGHQRYAEVEVKDGDQKEQTEEETSAYTTRMVNTVKGWLNMNKIEETDSNQDTTLNYLGMLNKTYDFMQDRMCEQSIEIHRPDIVVNIPRHVGTTLEFYRAEEMLEEGRSAAKKAIEAWRKNPIHA